MYFPIFNKDYLYLHSHSEKIEETYKPCFTEPYETF